MARVSVIIPTHERPEFLAAAIASVLRQSFTDFELIVVDDASGPATAEVVGGFRDPRVRYLRHDSTRGGAAARNTGIARASADYIAFLDDDDEWYASKLARQMERMRAAGPEVGCVYTGYRVVDRTTGNVRGRMIPTARGNLYARLLESNPIGGTSSVLVKKACLAEVGGFDESLPSFQDRDLWIRLARKFHFDFVQEPLLDYFVHPKKIWTNLEALTRGLEIMIQKYGDSPAFKKHCGARYLQFGVRLCEARQIDKGRKALLRALAVYPYRIQPYGYLLLSLLGKRGFIGARQAQAKIATQLRFRRLESKGESHVQG